MGLIAPPPSVLSENPAEPVVQYEQELASGRVGSIWLGRLAQGLEMGRLVSVRRIPARLLTDQVRERARKAAQAAVSFRHPALLRMLGIFEGDEELLCVSEHLQGVPLDALRRQLIESRTPMPIAVALRVARDSARAGALVRRWADERMLYTGQRLLFTDSIVVAAFGETLLRDVFLLSTLFQSPSVQSNPDVICGLSPEELSGPKAIHASSEVFSLGVLLWELLANRPVFSAKEAGRATSQVISQPIPRLDRVERIGLPMPKEIAALVARAIDRDPRRRMPGLDAFADAIEELEPHFVASSDQVGNCIRRLGSGFFGDSDKSSHWPIRPLGDSSAPSQGDRRTTTESGHNWEPETVAERKLLSSSVLEVARASDARLSSPSGEAASQSDAPQHQQNGVARKLLAAFGILLLVALSGVLYWMHSQSPPLRGPFNRMSPRPVPRFEAPPHDKPASDFDKANAVTPSKAEPQPIVLPPGSASVPSAKPETPAPTKVRAKPRRSLLKARPSGGKVSEELVPEQRWGI